MLRLRLILSCLVVVGVACGSSADEEPKAEPATSSEQTEGDDDEDDESDRSPALPVADAASSFPSGDESCTTIGETRACSGTADGGTCTGVSRCVGSGGGGEFQTGTWSSCECQGSAIEVPVDGDCVKVTCPSEAPNLVGCKLSFTGDDPRGCVANAPGSAEVFLKEGDQCEVGRVSGTILCSAGPAVTLDAKNCTMNKAQPIYGESSKSCPQKKN